MPSEKAYESNMTEEGAKNLVDIKAVEKVIVDKFEEIKSTVGKAEEQIKESGKVAIETKAEIEKLAKDYNELYDRVQDMEQKGIKTHDEQLARDLGDDFIKSDQFKDMQAGKQKSARMEIKTAIINATGQNQPLVPADRLSGINTEPNRILQIRDIIPASTTGSNLIEFVRENVFTNSAGPQVGGSPQAFENVTKPESGITFTLANEPVQTLAHWIPASKQVIEDSPQLQSFISGRLMYGLKLYEETQLLSGSGANGQLNGIITQATAWSNESPNITNKIDIIRSAIKQSALSEYQPDYIVMNPQDWYEIDVQKVGTSDDRYVVGNPREMGTPRLWGIPVVVTNSITAGTFLVGAFRMNAEIKDREMSSVEVSRENSDNFVKNMVTVLAEERIALIVYRTAAFITGSF